MIGRITKIKDSKDKVEIHYQSSSKKEEKQTRFTCTEKPHPDFSKAFEKITKHVRAILDIPADVWPHMMKVTGISFSMSEETGIEGAVITGQVQLETSNAPFCFNTPHLPFGQYSPTGNAPLMPEAAIADMEIVRKEAALYMDGSKREQAELAGTR